MFAAKLPKAFTAEEIEAALAEPRRVVLIMRKRVLAVEGIEHLVEGTVVQFTVTAFVARKGAGRPRTGDRPYEEVHLALDPIDVSDLGLVEVSPEQLSA